MHDTAPPGVPGPTWQLGDLVDLDRYPIHDTAAPRSRAMVEHARRGLRTSGCAVISGLVRPEGLEALRREIAAAKPTTHYSTQRINPYFHVTPSAAHPDRHAVNTFTARSSGFIPGDSWDPSGAMEALFRAPELAAVLAECLEVPELHCYADPLAGLTANVLDPGQQFPWHFDTNDFTITVLVDEADDGGRFEYHPDIRSGDDEGFDRVLEVLEGDRTGVHTLDLRPGDLQVFRGRFSLHRVTRVGAASRPRHTAIFAYTARPGVIGRVARTRQLFGRVLPEHLEAERRRVRGDALLD